MTRGSIWPHQLRRRFQLLIFDWDGTAVPDRTTPVPRLVESLDGLLRLGVRCAVITGTHHGNIESQCLSRLSSEGRKRLLLCTNRGSEFYLGSEAVPRFRREATPEEDRALDRAAESVRSYLESRGLRTRIIGARLNRRKIDLIPIERWEAPPKARIAELARAVSERISGTAIGEGGLREILARARELALEAGLSDPRITSDVKHVEIGLTDKGDSLRWIERECIRDRTPVEDVIVLGDEFGNIAGATGSDALMQISELEEAVFASVGTEPEGVPEGVLHVPGGPERFVDFLQYQAWMHSSGRNLFSGPIPTPNPSWLIEQEGFDPFQERTFESLFAVSNGQIGVRGSSEIPIPGSQYDLYVAGIYDRKAPGVPYSEKEFIADKRADPFSELVPFPSPVRLAIRADGVDLSPTGELGGPLLEHERILDMRKGLAFELFRFGLESGKVVNLTSVRCASMAEPDLLLQDLEISCEGGVTQLEIDPAPGIQDFGLRFPHLEPPEPRRPNQGVQCAVFRARDSGFSVCMASRVRIDGTDWDGTPYRHGLSPGKSVRLQRRVSVVSSRERPDFEAAAVDRASPGVDVWGEFSSAVERHVSVWREFWKKADIRHIGEPALTQAQRFSLFQLRKVAPRMPYASVGARGLTGRAYEGHVFWDTEIFTLPFYLVHAPEAARNIVLYRHRTLDGARRRARAVGAQGASFAWESTVTGDDVTPTNILVLSTRTNVPIFTGRQQIHITADVAWAAWKLWDATRDDSFLLETGGELLIETARFWASRVTPGKDGLYHIRGVVGPDEYHHGVDDNAYTNWMARFNLEKASWFLDWARERGGGRFAALSSERERWDEVRSRLYVPGPGPQGVIEQFDGFFGLRDVALRRGERLRAPIRRLMEWRETNRTKLIKQADVLMIPFLFPDALPREIVESNYRYYEPITDHGSSLSPSVHAAIAARLGFERDARRYFEESVNLDVLDLMRNTSFGIHVGNAGGAWQALILHALGYRIESGGIRPPNGGPSPGFENVSVELRKTLGQPAGIRRESA